MRNLFTAEKEGSFRGPDGVDCREDVCFWIWMCMVWYLVVMFSRRKLGFWGKRWCDGGEYGFFLQGDWGIFWGIGGIIKVVIGFFWIFICWMYFVLSSWN